MSPRKKIPQQPRRAPRPRSGHARQRQHLIDACIAALHMYGPSRTTVEKVVAIAKMSPGIVRFYFDSKAAMLVASLQFLAAEFETRVLLPVTQLKSTPVAALQLMVDLYLDPDIASPRKVSVWYAFWGEASSRQEYYDICGQKDERSAALVRELIEALIIETSQPQLDADGVALGLIGVLEILWQDIAFQTERDVDRPNAKRRCMAYLRSIFPGRFAAPAGGGAVRPGVAEESSRFAAWVYADARMFATERERLFRHAWAVVGHESEIPREGDFLTLDVGAERALVVRGRSAAVHALRNCCPELPHTLVVRHDGRFGSSIECRLHGLEFSLDGRWARGSGRIDLSKLEFRSVGGLMFVRSPDPHPASELSRMPDAWFDAEPPQGLLRLGMPLERTVAADWKVVVERWLEPASPDPAPVLAVDSCVWRMPVLSRSNWSARHYCGLVNCCSDSTWRRHFMMPNQLLESRPDGLSVVQVLPIAPGRCLLRRLDYTVLPPDDGARAVRYLAQRLGPYARAATLALAESIQQGMIEFGYAAAATGVDPPAVAWFRRHLTARVAALAKQRPPGEA